MSWLYIICTPWTIEELFLTFNYALLFFWKQNYFKGNQKLWEYNNKNTIKSVLLIHFSKNISMV